MKQNNIWFETRLDIWTPACILSDKRHDLDTCLNQCQGLPQGCCPKSLHKL